MQEIYCLKRNNLKMLIFPFHSKFKILFNHTVLSTLACHSIILVYTVFTLCIQFPNIFFFFTLLSKFSKIKHLAVLLKHVLLELNINLRITSRTLFNCLTSIMLVLNECFSLQKSYIPFIWGEKGLISYTRIQFYTLKPNVSISF